ncbi:MAG TPA: cation-translocating P-type ATPase [Pirellulales bacterium]|nr:cation-translocating P-type ATPase [Pirellulales bacterium]
MGLIVNAAEATNRYCDYCGLPSPHSWFAAREREENEPAYCCYGCRFAAEVAGQKGERGQSNWMLARLGVAIFLTINVVMFTMALWSQDVYAAAGESASSFAQSLDSLFRYLSLLLSLAVLYLLGAPLAQGAWQSLRAGVPSTDPLLVLGVAASYVYSAVSTFRGQGQVYFEVGCVVLVMTTLGRWLEATGKLRATEALDALEKLLPSEARVLSDRGERRVAIEELRPGDRIRVLAGERFAADGRIVRGRAAVDEQIFTGESQPAIKEPSDAVLSGTLNLDGELVIEVTAAASAGALKRLVAAVHEARQTKGDYQRLADRLSYYFLPAVTMIALASGVVHGAMHGLEAGILTGLAVVLIACPCALGLATPLAVWTAIGRAAGCQVLFKHGEALERLAGVRAVAFDKTGTLTTGACRVATFVADESTPPEEVLQAAAALATSSTHHFSAAIAEFADSNVQTPSGLNGVGNALCGVPGTGNGQSIPLHAERHRGRCLQEVRTLPGRGLMAGKPDDDWAAYLGSPRLMREAGLVASETLQRSLCELEDDGRSVVCTGWGGRVRGVFGFDEELRTHADGAVEACGQLGLHVAVVSGDAAARVERLGEQLGVPVDGELLPEDKVAAVHRLRKEQGRVAMVGDGINDAPVLAAADVGMAMGCGADVSRQAADVCLLSDDLRRVAWAVGLSRATVSTIRQNLVWACSYNVLGIALAASGRLNPVWAAAAMVVSSVLVIGNSLRLATWNS